MTNQQAFELAMAICQNEKKEMSEISDSQIRYYLADRDIEETAENIAMIRKA
jgi:NOL1/NOP2/fmu family ribosome biogenesis protein